MGDGHIGAMVTLVTRSRTKSVQITASQEENDCPRAAGNTLQKYLSSSINTFH